VYSNRELQDQCIDADTLNIRVTGFAARKRGVALRWLMVFGAACGCAGPRDSLADGHRLASRGD
jgi:hypothetical protein